MFSEPYCMRCKNYIDDNGQKFHCKAFREIPREILMVTTITQNHIQVIMGLCLSQKRERMISNLTLEIMKSVKNQKETYDKNRNSYLDALFDIVYLKSFIALHGLNNEWMEYEKYMHSIIIKDGENLVMNKN